MVSFSSPGIPPRFSAFLSEVGWIVGCANRHHATDASIDALLHHLVNIVPSSVQMFTSSKCLHEALVRYSGLSTLQFPCCSSANMAFTGTWTVSITCNVLPVRNRNDVCGIKTFEYFEQWPQMKAWVQSETHAPFLHENCNVVIEGERGDGGGRIFSHLL